MSVILMESFDHYQMVNGSNNASESMVMQGWTLSNTGSSTAYHFDQGWLGANKGYSLAMLSSCGISWTLPSTNSTMTVGFAYQVSSYSSAQYLVRLRNSTTDIVSVMVTTSGAIQAVRGSSAGSNVIGTSATGIFTAGVFHHVEVVFTRNASSGAITVYLDGIQVLTVTGANTGASDIDTLFFYAVTSNNWIDDLFVTNTASHVGQCKIESLLLDGDVSVGFTPNYTTSSVGKILGAYKGLGSATVQATYTVKMPASNSWWLMLGSFDAGSVPLPNTGWSSLAVTPLQNTGSPNNSFAFAQQIAPELIYATNPSTSTNSVSWLSPNPTTLTGSTNGCLFAYELPVDYDPTVDVISTYANQSTSYSANVVLPSVTATQDVTVFFLVVQSGGSLPSVAGTGVTMIDYVQTNGSSRYAVSGCFNVDNGNTASPVISWGGSPSTGAAIMVVVPRVPTGENYLAAKSAISNGDLAYNSTTSTGVTDQFSLTNLSSNPLAIYAVKACVIARKDDATTRQITPNVVSGGTSGAGPSSPALTTSYSTYSNIFETDPNTGSAWTFSAVNSMNLKYTSA